MKKQKRRHPLFLKIINELHQYRGQQLQNIAAKAGCCPATLYFWMDGKVRTPRRDTLLEVASALGFELNWQRKKMLLRKAS